MTLPNFLVIGAGKAGTTSLYEYLKEHPQIFVSEIKETNFFAWDPERPGARVWGGQPRKALPIRDLASYEALFDRVNAEIAIGEVSPIYLESLSAPQRIFDAIPDVKLVASLRQPVDRAYSSWCMGRPPGEVRPPLREAMAADGDLIQGGFYHALLERFTVLFGRKSLHVLLFDDLIAKPRETLRGLYAFLGVDPDFEPDTRVRHNPGGVPRNAIVDAILRARGLRAWIEPLVPAGLKRAAMRIRSANLQAEPPLPPKLRADLTELFRDDISKLEEMLERDLSSWLAPKPS